jgi:hypothetical protein
MSKDQPHIPLKDLQAWMQQVLINPLGTAEKTANDFLPEHLKGANVDALIAPSSKLNSRQRLAIYQQGYIARLRACMANQFKTLQYALGEELFEQFADMYIQAHPSTSYNLIHLGDRFADFLEATRPDKEAEEKESWIDFMIELITFEYYINTSFDEVSDDDYQLADNNTTEEALQLVPVFYLFEHEYPVLWYYQTFINGHQPEQPLPQKSYSLILRNNYQLELFPLQQAQYFLLRYIKKYATVPTAIKHFRNDYQINGEQWRKVWPTWKKHWMEAGYFKVR